MTLKKTTFKIRNLYTASFVYCKRSNDFVGLEADGRDFLFVFNNEPVCRYLVNQYLTRKATVSGKDYSDAIRTLKDLIFSRLREQNR